MIGLERRQYPRFTPVGLKAAINLETEGSGVTLKGEVIDISYDGIKIRFDAQEPNQMEGKIRIELFLPDSDVPITFIGTLKHYNQQGGELGLHYIDCPVVEVLDNFMFECIKLAKH